MLAIAFLLAGPVALLLMLAVATVCDIRYRRIPNWLSFSGLLAGLAWQGFVTFGPAEGELLFKEMLHGSVGLGFVDALYGALTATLVFLPLWFLRVVSGGDVKLMGAVGAFLGFGAIFNAVLLVWLVGGVLAMLCIGFRALPRQSAVRIFSFRREGTVRQQFPYAPAIAGGVLAHLAMGLSDMGRLV